MVTDALAGYIVYNLLAIGAPGTGKSMLAKRIPSILPPMTLQEALEATRIHSIAGTLAPQTALIVNRTFRSPHHTISDAGMDAKALQSFCVLRDDARELLKMAMNELNLSARAYDRILKVSRTIADLASSENIDTEHISEAIQYRTLDRQLWV